VLSSESCYVVLFRSFSDIVLFFPRMSTNLQEVVISYCNRIIEQCKLTRPAGNSPPVSQAGKGEPSPAGFFFSYAFLLLLALAAVDNVVKKHLEPPIESALVDAVRILDLLCTIDRSLVRERERE
jgi:hypothetical protein